ncbi:MAG: hypothetical protein H6907_17785 [Hyphomicrobiales bacterium]|nr:hypothetical protein [Hyphomicrobiales bacterium]MCP5373584.1 hypothetical protein [Hyphomicrobiales bacterium]
MAGATPPGSPRSPSRRAFLGGLAGLVAGGARRAAATPAGEWTALYRQTAAEAALCPWQEHAGSAYDSRRHRLVVFGSDTHGTDWTNSPLFLDLDRPAWRRAHPDDAHATYRADMAGDAVAGDGHPWAMHTFGAVEYDPDGDRLIVASHPDHLSPGRFTDAMAGPWRHVRRHPTWTYEFGGGGWRRLPGNAVSCFAHATVLDTDRNRVVGITGTGVHELWPDPRNPLGPWRRVAAPGPLSWGLNAAYDSRHRAVVMFGDHRRRDTVAVYRIGGVRVETMPTLGRRPPGDRYVPLAFHPRLGVTVALVQVFPDGDFQAPAARRRMETWLYDLGRDAWERLPRATLPFGWYMNYHLHYMARQDRLVLLARPPGGPVTLYTLEI